MGRAVSTSSATVEGTSAVRLRGGDLVALTTRDAGVENTAERSSC